MLVKVSKIFDETVSDFVSKCEDETISKETLRKHVEDQLHSIAIMLQKYDQELEQVVELKIQQALWRSHRIP